MQKPKVSIEYEIKKSLRTRTVRIAVFPDGRVKVFAPTIVPDQAIEKYLRSKGEWIKKHLKRMEERKANSFLPKFHPGDYEKHKGKALELIGGLVEKHRLRLAVSPAKISIRRQKSRWGSCSRKGNLNFNYRIVFLPERLAEYIVVHELCHLKEFNHSSKFWALVSSVVPDYRQVRKTLREGSIE